MTRIKRPMRSAADAYHAAQYPGDILADIEPPRTFRLRWSLAAAASLLIVGLISLLQSPATTNNDTVAGDSTPPIVADTSQPAQATRAVPSAPMASVPFKSVKINAAVGRQGLDTAFSKTPRFRRMTSNHLAFSAFPTRNSNKENPL